MKRTKYSALVLRYVHDLVSGEFVNVGLAFVCPERGFFKFAVLPRTKRVIDFFPGTKALTLRTALNNANRTGRALSGQAVEAIKVADDQAGALAEVAHQIVARDDSGLQWSEAMIGLAADPEASFDRLFDRLVLRYEEKVQHAKRSDDQVWRSFSRALEKRNVASRLQEHEVKAKLETVKFEHALKNGKWHLMEPVSFDLATAESITDKAKRLLGQMTLLKGSSADFKLYFLVGQPTSGDVTEGYEKALKILDEIPCEKAIYPEARAEEFAAELARVAAN